MINWYGLGLWCLTQLSTIFQLYRGGDYLNLIYPNVHEEKNTTDTQMSASFLDLHLEMDNETKDDCNTKFYDKRDDFKLLFK